jgi:hypothetical protein
MLQRLLDGLAGTGNQSVQVNEDGVDSGTRRNGLSKADLDVSAKLPE